MTAFELEEFVDGRGQEMLLRLLQDHYDLRKILIDETGIGQVNSQTGAIPGLVRGVLDYHLAGSSTSTRTKAPPARTTRTGR